MTKHELLQQIYKSTQEVSMSQEIGKRGNDGRGGGVDGGETEKKDKGVERSANLSVQT